MPGCCRAHGASESLSAYELVHNPFTKRAFRTRRIRAPTYLSQQELVQTSYSKSTLRERCIFAVKVTDSGRDRLYRTHAIVLAVPRSNDAHPPTSPAIKISEGDGLNDDNLNANRGMLSYGLLNTIYYLGMFLFAWFYISPAPSGLGYRAAAERFIKLFALVWAGSQVTKLLRAGCALALAPVIDRGLTWITDHSGFRSRAEVFGVVVTSCFGLAFIVFFVITFLWA
ncbi:hypothetical protein GOP47_0017663 [Adiantum capillus-veneris]|uniref:Uncharacterized protein n=1 Tax=Adiantum capillus-veneris TaxID=13818 RepID=A0A9D4ZB15_ADICA|nr:hypothetical protein GOP47_0017663 [Adiantum capillus-veneris]